MLKKIFMLASMLCLLLAAVPVNAQHVLQYEPDYSYNSTNADGTFISNMDVYHAPAGTVVRLFTYDGTAGMMGKGRFTGAGIVRDGELFLYQFKGDQRRQQLTYTGSLPARYVLANGRPAAFVDFDVTFEKVKTAEKHKVELEDYVIRCEFSENKGKSVTLKVPAWAVEAGIFPAETVTFKEAIVAPAVDEQMAVFYLQTLPESATNLPGFALDSTERTPYSYVFTNSYGEIPLDENLRRPPCVLKSVFVFQDDELVQSLALDGDLWRVYELRVNGADLILSGYPDEVE